MANYTFLIALIIIILIGVAIAIVFLSGDKKTGQAEIGIFSNTFYDNADAGDYGTAINIASQRWNDYINEDISIPVDYKTFNDPSSPILAYASMKDTSNIRGGGTITINIGRNAPPAGWDDVIEHELGHVLGLPSSTKWQNALITSGDNTYLDADDFPLTTAAYHELIPGSSGNIPLQLGGNHWNENVFSTELMTPNIGSENELITSVLTLTAMKEIGWDIDINQAESF